MSRRHRPLKDWLERDGALLRLRLARPKANLVDAAMIAALHGAFVDASRPAGLRGVLLDAEGPHFSFGASVEEHLPDRCAAMLASLHALILAMLEFPAPILVAVRGQCLGGGLEVALAGGPIFAAPDAQLGQPEMKLGVFAPAASLPAAVARRPAGRRGPAVLRPLDRRRRRRRRSGSSQIVADDPEARGARVLRPAPRRQERRGARAARSPPRAARCIRRRARIASPRSSGSTSTG